MAHHFNVLPKFDRLTALYRHRKSLNIPDSAPDGSDSAQRMAMSLTTKGLLNPKGENNCFLNSAVQVLWHIDVFRRTFREVKGHHCDGKSCIFCSLKGLFSEFQHDTGQSAIPPDHLRQSLALCYEGQRRFQLGLMDDAAECFERLLEQVHFHQTGSDDLDTCSVNYCISHQKFALTILERTECECGATSEPLSFVQFVHYVSASAFSKEAERINSLQLPTSGEAKFSRILNAASTFDEHKKCSNFANCGKSVNTKRILLNSPDVFCLGLIWDSASPSVDYIMSVVGNIGLSLQLGEVFDHVFSDSAQCSELSLTAVIAYYGRHYSTFCYHSKLNEWIYFDDAKHRTIGKDWSLVVDLIRKAHYQPLLLVYTNRFGETMDLKHAPTEVVLASDPPKAMPSLQELPEEIEASNQIPDDVSGDQHVELTQMSPPKLPPSVIDPMTFSIVPSAGQPSNKQGVAKSDEDLIMFSVSPAIRQTLHSAESAKTQNAQSANPGQAQLSSNQRSRHSVQKDQQSRLRMNHAKSDVFVEGSKVEATRHHYDDLMTFTQSTPANLTQVPRPLPLDSAGSGDLIQFSITPQQVARLQGKSCNPPRVSHDHAWVSHDPAPTSHDLTTGSHEPSSNKSTLAPKWDHFSTETESKSSERLSSNILNEMGVVLNEKWTVLSLNSPERELDLTTMEHDNEPVESSNETPALRSLKKMASLTEVPSQPDPITTSQKLSDSAMVRSSSDQLLSQQVKGQTRHDYSKRKLPEIPIPVPANPTPTSSSTGTYVELDFLHNTTPKQQLSTLSQSTDLNSRPSRSSEYSEITFEGKPGHLSRPKSHVTSTRPKSEAALDSRVPGPHVSRGGDHVTANSRSDALQRSSEQPITEDPLYAVPEHVKTRLRATDGNVEALPRWVQSSLSEARDLLAKAEAVKGSDDTVALVLLTQYKGILDKVLRDPLVISKPVLSQRVKAKRQYGEQLKAKLKTRQQSSVARVRDKCARCGLVRDLDQVQSLCGPCTLRVKLSS